MVVPVGVLQGNADDLVVDSLLVLHLEQRDRLDGDHTARKRRLGYRDHGVERVAVGGQGLGDHPVVEGIYDRREQEPIEADRLEALVVLVLVPAPLGNLDEHVQGTLGHRADPIAAATTTARRRGSR